MAPMESLETYMVAYIVFVSGLLGAVMGSFINCWAWRFMHDESVLKGRSHCTSCGHELGAADLVPIFSWVFSRGRCRYCGERVSARYPLTELVTGLVFVALLFRYGLSVETLQLWAFACVLLFLSLTDIEAYIIPNACIAVGFGIRIAYLALGLALGALTWGNVAYYAASALGVALVLLATVLIADRILGKESMGGGDLKLFALATFYVGWQQSLLLVIISCILGLVVGVIIWPRVQAKQGEQAQDNGIPERAFPFGPSIAAATIITLLCGQQVVNWYLGLFM